MNVEQNGNGLTATPDGLAPTTRQPGAHAWRDRAKQVGAVYTMTYTTAIIAVFDYDREKADGLPQNGFLMAAKQDADNGSFILLRVLKEARLPAAAENDWTRQGIIEDLGNAEPWSARMSPWVRDKLSLQGIECAVLGTFMQQPDGGYRFAEDIRNFYAITEMMAWKPDASTLHLIVNHEHRSNGIPIHASARIGVTRFVAAEEENDVRTEFRINPTDVMKRRTAYFGQSRSGKSNGLKVLAQTVYQLRANNPDHRIGQLIFDPNGEYAQNNLQDGRGLHCVHETLGLPKEGEVSTYGIKRVRRDPDRKLMKINFYGQRIPPWKSSQDTPKVERALEQLWAGQEIIRALMAKETTRYTVSFRDADLSIGDSTGDDHGAKTRYVRAVLAYRTALYAAGLQPPSWQPTLQGSGNGAVFSKELIDALQPIRNQNSDAHARNDYVHAAELVQEAKDNGLRTTWNHLVVIFKALAKFVEDERSHFQAFERAYTAEHKDAWADPRFRAVLSIFNYHNGPRSFQRAREQHAPDTRVDFADAVVTDLEAGKLVIIDQSAGESEQNQAAAERVMRRIYERQNEKFVDADLEAPDDPVAAIQGHVIVYVEEAHTLLPRADRHDKLESIWAKVAKHGSKLNVGMVLATQAPSSVMPEILSETDNWIVAYLNSEPERHVVSRYVDLRDFVDQIGKVSEQGFVRVRTLSQAYTVPVQLDRFRIDAPPPSRPPVCLITIIPKLHKRLLH